MQQRIALFRGPHSLGEWELADDPLELGSSALADIHVDEPALPARAYLIQAQGGTVWLYDLARAELKPRVLPLDGGLPLPGGHRLLRVQRDTAPHVAGRVAQTSRLDRSFAAKAGSSPSGAVRMRGASPYAAAPCAWAAAARTTSCFTTPR